MRLEQQMASENTSRMVELERDVVRIQNEKTALHQENTDLKKQMATIQLEMDRVGGTLSTFRADQLMKNELNNALTIALQQKTADLTVRMIGLFDE